MLWQPPKENPKIFACDSVQRLHLFYVILCLVPCIAYSVRVRLHVVLLPWMFWIFLEHKICNIYKTRSPGFSRYKKSIEWIKMYELTGRKINLIRTHRTKCRNFRRPKWREQGVAGEHKNCCYMHRYGQTNNVWVAMLPQSYSLYCYRCSTRTQPFYANEAKTITYATKPTQISPKHKTRRNMGCAEKKLIF